MSKTIKVALAGAGAFGIKHLDAIKLIPDVKVISLVSRELGKTQEVADKYGIAHVSTDLADSLAMKEVDAVILCTPTQMHAEQAIACMKAGKHVQVEIPLADSLAGAEAVLDLQQKTGLVAMCGHTRRFNPSHQWVHNKIGAGEFNIQQMDVQTYFFRRTNMNALGQARSWTDHLLWHHAAHTVDLFAYQTGGSIVAANALQGPIHPSGSPSFPTNASTAVRWSCVRSGAVAAAEPTSIPAGFRRRLTSRRLISPRLSSVFNVPLATPALVSS